MEHAETYTLSEAAFVLQKPVGEVRRAIERGGIGVIWRLRALERCAA